MLNASRSFQCGGSSKIFSDGLLESLCHKHFIGVFNKKTAESSDEAEKGRHDVAGVPFPNGIWHGIKPNIHSHLKTKVPCVPCKK